MTIRATRLLLQAEFDHAAGGALTPHLVADLDVQPIPAGRQTSRIHDERLDDAGRKRDRALEADRRAALAAAAEDEAVDALEAVLGGISRGAVHPAHVVELRVHAHRLV